jgi:hypothetical protein
MLFNTKQINQILENVDFYHVLYICENIGTDVLTRYDKALLAKRGIDIKKFNKKDAVTYSYQFGKLEASVSNKNILKKLNVEQYKKLVDSDKKLFNITAQDKYNIKIAKQQLYNDIQRLAGAIKADLQQNLIEASKTQKEDIGKKSLGKKVLQVINKKLKEANPTYEKRFGVISGYNMHSSFQEGISAQILATKGQNAKIYFTVHPDACEYCVRVYLKAGRNSPPKVFILKNVIANGSNIGRKAKQYKPSVQPLHPNCRCKMNVLPNGKFVWSFRQNKYIEKIS